MFLMQFFILNSNCFSDLKYPGEFETYFNFTEPQKSKFTKLIGLPQKFQKKNLKKIFFFHNYF